MLQAVGESRIYCGSLVDQMHADARSLAGSLDDDRERKRRLLPRLENLGTRCRNSGSGKGLLGQDLVESHPALLNALARVGDSPFLQEGLQVSILAKGPVNQVEHKFRSGRDFHLGSNHLDLGDIGTNRAKR